MNETHWCEDKNALVEYLYGGLDADSRRVFEGHLRTCVPCALEVESLQSVRSELAQWMPPEMTLGFTVIPTSTAQSTNGGHLSNAGQPSNGGHPFKGADSSAQSATVLRPARWSLSTMPMWARAAAAVLVVGAGLGLANLQVRSDANGLSVTTGWLATAAPSVPAAAPMNLTDVGGPGTTSDAPAWRPELAALEADLRKELQAMRTDQSNVVATSTSRASGGEDQALLRRIQTLIAESERRQEQELARRLTQFGREAEMQRRADLVRLEQGFGRVEAQRGAQAVRQQQMLDYLYRVSTSKVP